MTDTVIERDQIEADVMLLHSLAGSREGRLVLASFGENPESGEKVASRIEHFQVGQTREMVASAVRAAEEPYRNVYAAFSVMRIDLAKGKKGGERDVDLAFGLVADFDAKDDPNASSWRDRLPVAPSMVLETSSVPEPSFQCRFLFSEPVDPAFAKSIAKRLQSVSGCDSCTVDMSHVWRLAGTLNWPNRLKVQQHGRPTEPQKVKIVEAFAEDRLVDPSELADILGAEFEKLPEQTSNGALVLAKSSPVHIDLSDLDKWQLTADLREIIREGRLVDRPKSQDDSRSAWLFQCVCDLLRLGVPEETVLSLITDPAYKISASILDKGHRAHDYAQRQIERAQAVTADPILEELNSRHAVVENFGSKAVVFTFEEDGTVFHRSFEDFRKGHDHIPVRPPGQDRRVGRGRYFIEHTHRRQYLRAEFLPGLEAPEGVLNLFHGFSTQPKDGICDRFWNFVIDVICADNEKTADWLFSYLAHMFQKPWDPPEVAIVLRGRQGVGKNFFVEHVGSIIEQYSLTVTNPKHLVGSFNRHLMDKLLVFADEAFFGNEKLYRGPLKSLVTQPDMAVEPKGVDVFMAKKYFRLFLASNETWIVPADLDDRRYLVLDVSSDHSGDHEYFAAINKEWLSGGREAFLHRLMQRDISSFNHRKRPETPALLEQKLDSLIGAEKVVFDLLTDGEAHFLKKVGESFFISTTELRRHAGRQGLHTSSRAIGLEVQLIALRGRSERVTDGAGRQVRGYWLPELQGCRERWAQAKRIDVPWPIDDGLWADTNWSDAPI